MKMEMSCPRCQAKLEWDAPDEEVRRALGRKAILVEEPKRTANPEELVKQARLYARNFSEEGDAEACVYLYRDKEYITHKIVERFYEYSFVVEMLRKWDILGKHILDVGSANTVLPGILTAFGNKVTCLDIQGFTAVWPNLDIVKGDILEVLLPARFDLVNSVSTVEHFGLGRYGDKLDVDGDFKGMAKLKECLKSKGKLLLTFPVGLPTIVFPAHRVYNKSRFEKLTKGLKVLEKRFFHVDKENGGWLPCAEEIAYIEPGALEGVATYALGCFLLEKE